VSRATPDAVVSWAGPLPDGCAGAPVFVGLPMPDEQTKLVCLGLALPTEDPQDEGTAGGVVVTFDRLRPAIHALAPARKRRWWQRGASAGAAVNTGV